jgi:hypothetical protein
MKKIEKMMFLAVAILLIFSSVASAEIINGVVASVNAETSELVVQVADANKSVVYSATTEWPAGVTAPAELVGKAVVVTTDDMSGQALVVSLEAVQAEVPAEVPAVVS